VSDRARARARARIRTIILISLAGCAPRRGAEPARCPAPEVVSLGVQSDVAAFATCARASGLVIRTGAPIDLAPLVALEQIDGDLVVGPTVGLEQLQLTALRRVGGAIRVTSNGALASVLLPQLETAARIEIAGNAALTTIALPKLASVAGALALTGNHDLALLDLAELVAVGGELAIADQPELALVQAGKLARAGSVRLENVPRLPPEVVDGLRTRAAGGIMPAQ
jgi:hypothetical protein